MSSPQMMRMLGFFCCAGAVEATKTSAQASAVATGMRFVFTSLVRLNLFALWFADQAEFHIHVLAGEGVKVRAGQAIGRRMVGPGVGRGRGMHVSPFDKDSAVIRS